MSSQHAQSDEQTIPSTMILALVQWDIKTEIADAQVRNPSPPECLLKWIYVPPSLQKKVLQWVNSSRSSRHPGITVLEEKVLYRTLKGSFNL